MTDTSQVNTSSLSFKKIALLVFIFIVLVAAWIVSQFSINNYKADIEKAVSAATGLPVSISNIAHSMSAPGKIQLQKIEIGDGKDVSITVNAFSINVDVWKLLSKDVFIKHFSIENISVLLTDAGLETINKATASNQADDGNIDEADEVIQLPINSFAIETARIEPVNIQLQTGGNVIEVSDITFSLADMVFVKNGTFDINDVQLSLKTVARRIGYNDFDLNKIKSKLVVNEGIAEVQSFNAKVFNGDLDVRLQYGLVSNDGVTVNEIALNEMVVVVNDALFKELGISPESSGGSSEPPARGESNLPMDVYIEKLIVKDADIDVEKPNLIISRGLNVTANNLLLSEMIERWTTRSLTAEFSADVLEVDGKNLGKPEGKILWYRSDINIQKLKLSGGLADLDVMGSSAIDTGMTVLKLKQLDIDLAKLEKLVGKLPVKSEGTMGITGTFSLPLKEEDPDKLLAAIDGNFSASGNQLQFDGIDLDGSISGLKDSQETGLIDIGGVILTGPVGLIAGQMLDLGSGAITTSGGKTLINAMEANGTIKAGKVELDNTAFATKQHRMAFKGGIDIVQQSFEDFTFAILDGKGCASVEQSLSGSISKPVSAVTQTLLGNAMGQLMNLAKKASLDGGKCSVFYAGNVAQPGA